MRKKICHALSTNIFKFFQQQYFIYVLIILFKLFKVYVTRIVVMHSSSNSSVMIVIYDFHFLVLSISS